MWIIDRFEGDMAVIECDEITFDVPKVALPKGAEEGDVVDISLDKNETEKRRKKISSLMNELFDK